MIGQLIGSLTGLATSIIDGKTQIKLTEAEIKKKQLTGEIDWDLEAMRATENSWKDEWITLLFSIPLILAFCGEWGNAIVAQGFASLEIMPQWYQIALGGIVSASIGMRSVSKFFGKNNVIKMPQLSETDRQFIILEKQQELIREQAKLIVEKKMTFQLSNRSKGRLEGVNPQLVQVVNEAIKRTKIDFGVTCGMRTVEEQEKLVASGASQTMKSKHLEGRAVDLVAYIGSNITWKLNKYDEIADAMAEAARKKGIAIKWGAAWSVGDIAKYSGSMEDAMNEYIDLRRSQGRRPFIDAPHFEMM